MKITHSSPLANDTAGAPLVAATTAMLVWQHRRGETVRSLLRLRTVRAATLVPGQGGLVAAAVVSELRDNPRGTEIGSDFAALATTALLRFIPPACPPHAVTWWAHHGEFSSYDPAGPETLTRIPLHWDTDHYQELPLSEHQLLGPQQFTHYAMMLGLEPVADLLGGTVWESAVPERPATGTAPGPA